MTRGYMAVDTRIHACIVFISLLMITDVNVVSRQYWGAVSSAKQQQRMTLSDRIARIFKRNDRCAVEIVSDPAESITKCWMSSCEIMKSPAMNAAFAAHVEKYVLLYKQLSTHVASTCVVELLVYKMLKCNAAVALH
jgi:hypothetical protein